MSLQISMLLWFYFAVGFGFFLGGLCAAPPQGPETKADFTAGFFGSILFWPFFMWLLLYKKDEA